MECLFDFDGKEDDELEMQDVRSIISDFKILSKTRESSKVWQDTFTSMHQLVNGSFLGAHEFDKGWMNKVIEKYDLFSLKFTWCELIKRTREILTYIEERKPMGFWFPRSDKTSLCDFYCSYNKAGKCWSPFIELCFVDCCTPMMYRKMFGPKICEAIDAIAEDCWFSFDYDTKVKFYKGVDSLHEWYLNLPNEFIRKCDSNNLVFGKFSAFLENIRQCNKDTGCIYPSFINPNMPKWQVLVDWLVKKKRIEL